eukprot:CAMPEP_0168229626 /NCGR_PEP_ID=MMETSP0140_2-20121125/15388_1 /TAXON_ID=44445 /ORGANISM="Pseudo-nitzschia australis, Strain 10249 10 AB" /LENGTH=68 /DNA_ID=CAMNT_0008161475 /DNA_START=251 /DNA_END=453 /DNA_ORIENTATION=-
MLPVAIAELLVLLFDLVILVVESISSIVSSAFVSVPVELSFSLLLSLFDSAILVVESISSSVPPSFVS